MSDEEQPSTCLVCGDTAVLGTSLRLDTGAVPIWFCDECLERVEEVVNDQSNSLLDQFLTELTTEVDQSGRSG